MTRSTTATAVVGTTLACVVSLACLVAGDVTSAAATVPTGHHPSKHPHRHPHGKPDLRLPGGYRHLVVIYEENHSFDNLMGTWGRVGRQRVDGLQNATATELTQVGQDGTPYACLPQDDANLASPRLPNTCQDPAHAISASHFANSVFLLDDYILATDRTPVPRFYQEQYQIDGGRMDRYSTGSDAVGLTQGVYDSRRTPLFTYLHSRRAPHYVVADRFFQAAFGGSFLNHQFLIAGRAPLDTSAGAGGARNSVLDSNAMPTSYPHYLATGTVVDGELTQRCADGSSSDAALACGNFAVNTVQPAVAPESVAGATIPLIDDATYPNIGDRLSARKISWKWYAGGWDRADNGAPGQLFQFHHQPFNYFANYAPGQPGRAHLQDETRFFAAVRAGRLPMVSFVKPYGTENQHPGYASQADGSDHLVNLLRAINRGPQARKTLVVVTYDEFGGQWDHVSPPEVDAWGPGTRVPALVLSKRFRRSGVDHTTYDTTSILATIERSYGLAPLSSRDATVNGLRKAILMGSPLIRRASVR